MKKASYRGRPWERVPVSGTTSWSTTASARALGAGGADGVVLLSNYEGVYLGDAKYAPLWNALNRRSAIAFIHPGHPLIPLLADVPGPLVDYPFDTTRNSVQMVFSGVLDKYPNVKIILAHAGGFVPYAVLRFCELQPALDPEGPTTEQLLAKFKLFHWDAALSSGPDAFPSFLAFADHKRILFGSDFPYAPRAGRDEIHRDTRHAVRSHRRTAGRHRQRQRQAALEATRLTARRAADDDHAQ
ncbi:amidohydrolase family protein [Streptomyces sp. NPDC059697]|uniref:amidohydrolase family protein n=1 Tax=Streptomyces sp. NPDC059697 TaxID=3346912 RepID=UPI00368F5609